jgi:hypothetical protein
LTAAVDTRVALMTFGSPLRRLYARNFPGLLRDWCAAPPAEGTYPPVCGHSGFWTRPEYRDAVNMLEASLLPAGSTTDTTAAAYPTEELL